MKGPFAEDLMMFELLQKQGRKPWILRTHFKVSEEYPYSPADIGTHQEWTVPGRPVRLGGRKQLQFHALDCWCTERYITIQQGTEMMRIRFPDDAAGKDTLEARAARSHLPEVIPFRPGTYRILDLLDDPVVVQVRARWSRRMVFRSDTSGAIPPRPAAR